MHLTWLWQAQTFAKVLDSNASEQSEDKSITAMGILNTLEIICSVLENQAEVSRVCAFANVDAAFNKEIIDNRLHPGAAF